MIDAGHAAGKWVGLCGELAGDRLGIPVLLGLGLDEFSMTPRAIPMAKRLLRLLDSRAARQLVENVLGLSAAEDVERAVADFLARMGEQ